MGLLFLLIYLFQLPRRNDMTFAKLSSYLFKLEKTTLRNSIVEILGELFRKSSANDISMICYLTQGRVAPMYQAVEFGLADKMMIRAIALANDTDTTKVLQEFKNVGDLGEAVFNLTKHKGQDLSISDVFETLTKVASSNGSGSQEAKLKLLADLLRRADQISSKYIVRITLDKLRLGFSDMTVLSALALSTGLSMDEEGRKRVRELKDKIEEKYNVRPDLGYIAKVVKDEGEEGLNKIKPSVGTPILMARAERLTSGEEIIKKIGRCAVEYKFDGFRCQVHKRGNDIKIYSRNLENTTFMYPDLVEGVKKQIVEKDVVFEGEAIAYRPETGEFLPFQETVQRKRKYNVNQMAAEIPLKLFSFDILELNGKAVFELPYSERKKILRDTVKDWKNKESTILLSEEKIVESGKEIEIIFDDSITRGLEGIVAKRLDGVYAAGARNFNWIKLKRSYSSKIEDTIDAVVMGYDFGQGKRSGFGIGAFLIGVYDEKADIFKTIAKIGTGLSDEEWKELQVRSQKFKTEEKPALFDVDKLMACDVWVKPEIMVVIKADEITRSPVHTAGRELEASKSGSAMAVKTPGYALRFPRLVEFRGDKRPDDATSVKEVIEMYGMQKRMEMKEG